MEVDAAERGAISWPYTRQAPSADLRGRAPGRTFQKWRTGLAGPIV